MRFFREKAVETKLSLTELIHRLNNSLRLLISYVRQHAVIVEPTQRAEIEKKITEEIDRFQVHNAKFRRAFLDRISRNNLYVTKLISNMDVKSLLTRYPDPKQVLDGFGAKSEENLKMFMNGESQDREKSHFLRRFARELRTKLNLSIKIAKKAVEQKISTAQKQQQTVELKKQQELTAKQRQEQAISGKQPAFRLRRT